MTEKYDMVVYGPKVFDPVGLMTKEEAEATAKTLPAGYRMIGWIHGTCQSVFQYWVPSEGHVVEILHNGGKLPTGRKAAIAWTKEKNEREAR